MTANAAANDQGSEPVLDIEEFARTLSDGGSLTMVAIYLSGKLIAQTYDHKEAAANACDFAEVHQEQGANIYFAPNQTHGPISTKPAKKHMALARAVWADIDPREDEELKPGGWDRERQRLLALGDEL